MLVIAVMDGISSVTKSTTVVSGYAAFDGLSTFYVLSAHSPIQNFATAIPAHCSQIGSLAATLRTLAREGTWLTPYDAHVRVTLRKW